MVHWTCHTLYSVQDLESARLLSTLGWVWTRIPGYVHGQVSSDRELLKVSRTDSFFGFKGQSDPSFLI